MSMVNLVSGGLDSTLVGVMAQEDGHLVHPLFIDYGQRAAQIEWETCCEVHISLKMPSPVKLDLSGFGQLVHSGLTCKSMDVKDQAFTPCRNLVFLVMAAAYAHQMKADSIAIGLLSEKFSLFPDQQMGFLASAEHTIHNALGHKIKVLAPLSDFCKSDVVRLAALKGVRGTYSCHVGDKAPCGKCISCLEFGEA